MEQNLKKTLRALSAEIRNLLEGQYDSDWNWVRGDLEQRLNALGIWRDRPPKPVAELHLDEADRLARRVVDAYLVLREEAGECRNEAVAEFVRGSAYTWANRLFALRCMEARGIIDEVILQKDVYGGRSLVHNRFIKKNPDASRTEDDGLYAMLFEQFAERTSDLATLFNPKAPLVILRPSTAALKRTIGLLSGREALRGQELATDDVFTSPDALGWMYQFYQEEEKHRIDDWLKNKKNFKCEGPDLIPKTALYTEPYMVRFLVQNSLGALWMGMYPGSRLYEDWKYYVRAADRAPMSQKLLTDFTFLDPACGSGHFLVEAFDLFYAMYLEEGAITEPAQICSAILQYNLFGIDIDEHAIQIAALALVMKAKEKAPDFVPLHLNLVATNIRLPVGKDHLDAFLRKHPEDTGLSPALLLIFEGLAHADELGALLQIEEPVDRELRRLRDEQLSQERKAGAGSLFGPHKESDWAARKHDVIERLRQHFNAEAEETDFAASFFGEAVGRGLSLVDLLARRYDVVATNPPYLGSQNMGGVLKHYIQKRFRTAKRDLYAAFILRCLELSGSGRTAMVTQQAWMFLKQMHRIRATVLKKGTVEVLGHLGPGAFEEISGRHVNVVLFVVAGVTSSEEHRITAVRTSWDTPVKRRSLDLAIGATRDDSRARFQVKQSALATLPAQPFVYWCSARFLQLLRSKTNYEAITEVGYTASANKRFVRYHWEIPQGPRWRNYSKGGGFRRWAGLQWHSVDWREGGQSLSAYVKEHYPADKYSLWMKAPPYKDTAIVWSEIGSGAMGARLCPPNTVISRTGPGILDPSESSRTQSLGLLNSRASTYLLRVACSGLHFAYPYVAKLHRPGGELDAELVQLAVQLSEYLATVDPCEREYVADLGRLQHVNAIAAVLACVEAVLDDQATSCFDIDSEDRKAIDEEVGINAGSFSPAEGLDSLPPLPGELAVPEVLLRAFAKLPRRPMNDAAELAPDVLLAYAKACGERSLELTEDPEADENDEDEENQNEEDVLGVHPPMPAATAIEEAARATGIHPISVYWIVRSRSTKGPRERSVYWEQYLALVALRLMGHQWPGEIERDSRKVDLVDRDGIIPITAGTREATLEAQVRDQIAADFGPDRVNATEIEFQEIMGKSLGEWLAADLFTRHASQFRKRPILWQIESITNHNARSQNRRGTLRAPAFSCLVYYHRLDADLLPKLRTHYVGPLRTSFQTELASLERIESRSADQAARCLELESKLE